MTKRDKDLTKEIEGLGYAFDRTNSKGHHFYVHEDTGCEMKLIPGADERRTRSVLDQARHMIGLPTKDNKRNPERIRERNAAEHAKATRELAALAEAREDGTRSASEQQMREIEEAYLRAERKFRYWDRLMRSTT